VLQAVRTIFAVGLVLFVGAWIAGPSAAAVKVRSAWDNVLGRGGSAAGAAVDLGPVPVWLSRHLNAVRGGIVALAVLVLVWWDRPTGKVVLLLGLATLVPLAIVQLLANAAPRHDDGQGPDDGPASAPPDALVPADA
jgi:hypothetical protein